ncbi:hypothetical protein D3C73_1508890 [compost metagenome]
MLDPSVLQRDGNILVGRGFHPLDGGGSLMQLEYRQEAGLLALGAETDRLPPGRVMAQRIISPDDRFEGCRIDARQVDDRFRIPFLIRRFKWLG